jgi:hypothetical protein
VLPQILHPLNDESIVIGVRVYSSDYGCGAFDVREYIMRLICVNGMVGERLFRQVHHGGLIGGDEGGIDWSHRTLMLGQRTVISAMQDAMDRVFDPKRITAIEAQWSEAAGDQINTESVVQGLRRSGVIGIGIGKELVKMVKEEERVEVLPDTGAKETRLRLAQALSFLAQREKNADRRSDMEEAAGDIMKQTRKAA